MRFFKKSKQQQQETQETNVKTEQNQHNEQAEQPVNTEQIQQTEQTEQTETPEQGEELVKIIFNTSTGESSNISAYEDYLKNNHIYKFKFLGKTFLELRMTGSDFRLLKNAVLRIAFSLIIILFTYNQSGDHIIILYSFIHFVMAITLLQVVFRAMSIINEME